MSHFHNSAAASLLGLLVLVAGSAGASEVQIRKAMGERYGTSLPVIDEIRQSAMDGIWEVRMGTEIVYASADGAYIFQGSMIDTATRRNLTEERVAKLTAIDFSALPLKDAVVWKNGSGKRRIAVFADPNCGYCKRLERDLLAVKDVTVYTFILPILGGDSPEKSRSIWCAKDSTAAWRSWMVDGEQPAKVAACDASAIERNAVLARKHKVTGTPAIIFEDGSRAPGALPATEIEKRLAAVPASLMRP